MKSKFFCLYIIIFSTCLFSCSLFNTSLSDFLEEYTEKAAIERMDADCEIRIDNSGNRCIGSDQDVDFTFYLRNPREFPLNMEYYLQSDALSTVYKTLTQDEDKLIAHLSIPKSDLETKEKNGETLDGIITLTHQIYNLPYNSYNMNLKIDSVPPTVKNAMIQLTAVNNGEYILCFYLPVVNGTVHERDTKTLKINNKTWYFSKDGKKIYTDSQCTTEDTQNFASSMTVYPLDDGSSVFDPLNCPAGYFPWFYKTGITESTQEHRFTVTIEDDAGFSSDVNISSQGYQLKPVTFEIETSANQFEPIDEDTSYNANSETATAKIRLVHSGKTVSSSAFPEGKDCGEVDVTYAVYSQSNTIDPNPYKTGKVKVSKDNPGIIELPYGENYYIKADVSKDYYIDSDTAVQKIKEINRNSNIYYVSNSGETSNGSYYSLQKGGLGTRNEPFKSLQDVVIDITNYNDSYSEYSINLLSNLTLDQPATYMMDNTLAKDITLNGNGYTIDGKNKCESIIMNNPGDPYSTLTLKDVTLTGGGIIGDDSVYGSAIFLGDGRVKLESGTVITGNISTFGAVYVAYNTELYVSGKVNITGNKYYEPDEGLSEQERNVYLESDMYIYVDGPLAGSKIGVTTYAVPTVTEPIVLTSWYNYDDYYSDNYNLVPSTVFLSDDYYGITTNNFGEVVVTLNGAAIEQPEQLYDVITITPNRTVIEKARSDSFYKQISFTIKKGSTNISLDDFKVEVYSHGDLYKTYTTTTITDFASYPNDNYQLVVYGTYNGKVISNTFDIRVLDYVTTAELTAAPRTGTYSISTVEEFNRLVGWANSGSLQSATFILTDNITLPDDYNSMGTSTSVMFKGTLDGNGKTISNLKKPLIKFGSGTIKNLTVEGDVTGSSAFIENTGLYGSSNSRIVITIDNCTNYANVTGSAKGVGAFYGSSESYMSVTIKNCVNYGKITNNDTASGYTGGIAGSCSGFNIINCANHGAVSGKNAGGIYGYYGKATNCVNYGNVEGSNSAGGIAGNNKGDTGNTGVIQNCINAGIIAKKSTSTTNYIGQIIGYNEVNPGITEYGIYNNCYYINNSVPVVGVDSRVNGNYQYINSYTKNSTSCETSEPVTIGSTTSKDVVQLLNAWVGSSTTYKRWIYKDGYPALQF